MRRHRRPVVELSVTYEPAMGVIEVVSPDQNKRDELARLFADTVLSHSIAGHRIRLREYDLSRVLAPFDFLFDAEDGIESVELVLSRVQRPESGGKRTTLETPRRASGSIWDRAIGELRDGDLAAADYIATLDDAIADGHRLQAERAAGRLKSISLGRTLRQVLLARGTLPVTPSPRPLAPSC